MTKSVVVIGGGSAGITTIKACLEEGLDVVCYELTDSVGGLWKYRENEADGNAVHNCTYMNSSKEMSAYSDFPPREDLPNYMHHKHAQEYFESYAEHFDLLRHVRFRHKVVKVKENKGFNGGNDKRWSVEVEDLTSSKVVKRDFDAVAICTGLLGIPFRPNVSGLDKFKGQILHSVSYRTARQFEGKKVAVVGMGNSAGDIAVDLCNVASEVYLSTRAGAWVFGRAGPGGLPNDLHTLRRFNLTLMEYVPRNWIHSYVESSISKVLNHGIYGLKPRFRALEHAPLINDDIRIKLLKGDLSLKKDLGSIDEDGVTFVGDSQKTPLDAIIFCTGFEPNMTFLEKSEEEIVRNSDGVILYKFLFPPDYGDGTLAFVGFVAAFGPIFPMSEMQARFFAAVQAGKVTLPSPAEMKRDIGVAQKINKVKFSHGERNAWYNDYLPYMEDLAGSLNVAPSLLRLMITDPVLFWHCLFGPLLAYQYRLQGPHAWSGARDAIVNCYARVLRPFKKIV